MCVPVQKECLSRSYVDLLSRMYAMICSDMRQLSNYTLITDMNIHSVSEYFWCAFFNSVSFRNVPDGDVECRNLLNVTLFM